MNARNKKKIALELARNTAPGRCTSDRQVLSPKSNRCIRVDGEAYRRLVNEMARKNKASALPRRSQPVYGSTPTPIQGSAFYYVPGATVAQFQQPKESAEIEKLKQKLLDYQISAAGGTFRQKVHGQNSKAPLTEHEKVSARSYADLDPQTLGPEQKALLKRYKQQHGWKTWAMPWKWRVTVNDQIQGSREIFDMAKKLSNDFDRKRQELEQIKTNCDNQVKGRNKDIKDLKIELELLQHEMQRYKALSSSQFPWIKEIADQDDVIQTLRGKIKELHAEINQRRPSVRQTRSSANIGHVANSAGAVSYGFLKELRNTDVMTNRTLQHYLNQIDSINSLNSYEKLEIKKLFQEVHDLKTTIKTLRDELQTRNTV